MARITKIKIDGLKGQHREIDLGKLSVLTGAVGAGKSSVMNGLVFAALGFVPAVGKSAAATARLMAADAMSAGVTLDDGRSFAQSLATAKRGGLTRDAAASWIPDEATTSQRSASIAALFGATEVEAAESLDLRELLNCSANERAKKIEQLLDASGLPLDALIARARAVAVLRLAGTDPKRIPSGVETATAAAAGSRELVADAERRETDRVLDALEAVIRQDGLAAAIASARKAKLEHRSAAEQKVAARAEFEERRPTAPAEPIAELEAKRDAALAAAAQAEERKTAAATKAEERQRAETTLPALRQALAEAEAEAALADENLPRAAEATEEAEGIEIPEQPEAPEQIIGNPEVVKIADEREARADRLSKEADAIVIPDPLSTMDAHAAHVRACRDVERAQASPWREVERIADELGADGAESFRVSRLLALALDHGGDTAALTEAANTAYRVRVEADRASDARIEEITEAKATRDHLRAQASDARAEAREIRETMQLELNHLNGAAREQHKVAKDRWKELADALKDQRKALQDEARRIRQTAGAASERLTAARADLRAAEAKLEGIGSAIDEDFDTTIAARTAEAADLAERIAAGRSAAAALEEMRALQAEITRETALHACHGAAEWACQRLREEDLAARAGGIEALMARFLAGAGRPETPYLRATKGVCDFGWVRDGKEVSVETLSGGESALFCAALAAAVIALRAPEVRVLLVEAAELGVGETALSVLRGIEAVADSLDTVIVATCAPIEVPENWTEIACGEALAAGKGSA